MPRSETTQQRREQSLETGWALKSEILGQFPTYKLLALICFPVDRAQLQLPEKTVW